MSLLVEAPWIGRPVARREDVRFTTGAARYVDDLRLPDMLHAAFARSPFAHARVNEIDPSAALAVEGVRHVLSGEHLNGRAGRFPINPAEQAQIADMPIPVLAGDRVRFVGEPVAVVVAETAALAADAAELVVVDYEELPAVVDPHRADTVLLRWEHAEGDVERAFAAAAHVVRQTIRVPRLVAAPLEPRAALAAYDAPTDLLTLWLSAQDPHRQRSALACVLRRDPEQLRVVVPDVGGAFGSKGVPAPEAAAVAFCALDLGRPVKWIETRTDNFLAAYQGRGLDVEAELALDADGQMLAVRARYVADLGAYLYPSTPIPSITAAKLLPGCYTIPAAAVDVVGAATNKVPTGPYRGAGRPEAALVIERLVDVAALELGIDRIELRRRNLIPRDAFPYRTPTGFTYDSGDYERCLDRALELLGPVEESEGVGVAMYVERVGPGWEYASVTLEEDGRVVCRVGSTPHGQGHETTFAQIAADELGVALEHVEVRWGDSADIPAGTGTFASRSMATGGSALLLACREVKGKDPPAFAEFRFELPGPVFSSGCYAVALEVEQETGEPRVRKIVAVDDAGTIVNPLLAEGQVVGAVAQALGECFFEQLEVDEDGQPRAVNFYEYHIPTAQNVAPVVSELIETPSPLNPLGAKGIGEGGTIGTTAAVANAIAAALGVRHVDLPFTPARLWAAMNDQP